MERTYKVDTFVKLLFCDKCGKQITERECVLVSNPIQSVYKCECGEEVTTTVDYPCHFSRIVEEVKEDTNSDKEGK